MTQSDQAIILDILRAQERAVAAADAQGALRAMADGVVLYDLPPPLSVKSSREQGEAALNEWFATWKDGVKVEIVEPEILVSGDLAVAFGLSRMRGTKKDSGFVDMWSRRTIVLRKQGGSWQIVHEHNSVPMAMDGSEKALTDLKPA